MIFFFNDAATTEISTLSLHDALPIYFDLLAEAFDCAEVRQASPDEVRAATGFAVGGVPPFGHDLPVVFDEALCDHDRSEEHTSELQSRQYLLCRLLLQKRFIGSIGLC